MIFHRWENGEMAAASDYHAKLKLPSHQPLKPD